MATTVDHLGTQTVTFSKANQATLSMSSASSDTYPWSITLATTGGNGAGAVTYAVANGTATGCTDPGGVLTATTSGTCTVTATKAMDTDYNAISSTPQTVTFTKANQGTLDHVLGRLGHLPLVNNLGHYRW